MLPNPQPCWHAVPDFALTLREWDGEVVVFNQETGSTHLLSDLAAEVLRLLLAERRGATVEALAAGLTDAAGGADAEHWAPAVAEVLSNFERLGLARPESP